MEIKLPQVVLCLLQHNASNTDLVTRPLLCTELQNALTTGPGIMSNCEPEPGHILAHAT